MRKFILSLFLALSLSTPVHATTEYIAVCAGQSNAVGVCPRLQTKLEAEFPADDVTTINAAVGGTDMAEWQKGGQLYADMLAAIDGREIDFLVFWQGEGNAQNEAEANEWQPGMLQFITDVRSDLGATLPIIIVQIGSDPDPSKATYKYWYHVWAAQQWFDGAALFGSTPQYRVKLIQTWDLPRDVVGGVHHTNAGYNTAANRIIAKFKNIMGIP